MKVTVAIPTIAGREHYLVAALATCLAQPDANLEILVSDNSPGDAEAIARGTGDPRVRYVRPDRFLPMATHWDFLLDHVTGDMVTIIGDDDGIMPGAVAAVTALVAEHGLVPIHHALANYFWPDHPLVARRNRVAFFHAPGTGASWHDSSAFLGDVAAARSRYLDGPMIYHNFIPTALVRRIAADGVFFRRAIPDVYSAFAIAAGTTRFLSTDRLLTLSGSGGRSNGSSTYAGTAIADAFFTATAADPLFAPRSPSRAVPMLQLDALLEVCAVFDRPDIAARIDTASFLEFAVLDVLAMPPGPRRRAELRTIADAARTRRLGARVATRIAGRAAARAARRLGLPIARRPSGPDAALPDLALPPSVATVADAVIALDNHLRAA